MKTKLIKAAQIVAAASNYNPIVSTIVVFLYYCAFNFVEGMIETLITGERFLHVGDVVSAVLFTAFNSHVIYICAVRNILKDKEK